MGATKRKLLLSEATPLMLLALALTFFVMGIFAFAIVWPIGIIILLGSFYSGYLYVKYSRVRKSITEDPGVTTARVVSKTRSVYYENYSEQLFKNKMIVEFTPIGSFGVSESVRLDLDVADKIFDGYQEGDLVSILYAKADPRFAMLKGEDQSWHSNWPE